MRQGTTEVKQEHEKSNVMLFLSSRDNETSIERKDMKNGFFTTCLVSALRGKADSNRDRTISAKELFTSMENKEDKDVESYLDEIDD